MAMRLDIPPGIRSADTSFARPGCWRDASLVRFFDKGAQVFGGWEQVTVNQIGGVCRTVAAWTDNANRSNIVMGRHNGLSLWRSGEDVDLTPTSGFTVGQIDGTGGSGYGTGAYGLGDYGEPSTVDYFPLTWSFGNYGQSLIANPRNQGIFQWNNDTAVKPALLTNAPARCTIVTVTPTRQIMALGCTNTGGTFDPLCIRISDAENITVWNIATSNLADQITLDGGGRIVGCAWLGESLSVWTNNGLWSGRFTGSYEQPWKFDKVADDCGLMGPNAVAVLNQVAYWMAPTGRVFACGVGGIPQMLTLGIDADIANNIAPAQFDKIVLSTIGKFGEVICFYPDARDGYENSRYFAFQPASGLAYPGRMARTAWCDIGAANDAYPIGISFAGDVYYHEKGISAAGLPLTGYLESSVIALDDSDTVWLISSVRPDFKDQVGPVAMTIMARLYPQDTDAIYGPYTFVSGQNKVDMLASGRFVSFRLDFSSYPSFWRLGSLSVDAKPTGTK